MMRPSSDLCVLFAITYIGTKELRGVKSESEECNKKNVECAENNSAKDRTLPFSAYCDNRKKGLQCVVDLFSGEECDDAEFRSKAEKDQELTERMCGDEHDIYNDNWECFRSDDVMDGNSACYKEHVTGAACSLKGYSDCFEAIITEHCSDEFVSTAMKRLSDWMGIYKPDCKDA